MSTQNKKVIMVTGASGAIGCHVLAHICHNTDWDIIALDSFDVDHKGYFDRITRVCRNHPDWPARIKIFTHDLNAPLTQRQVEQIGHVDYIVNLASRSDVQNSINDPAPFVKNNVALMLNILDYALKAKPEIFLHFSTDEVYGPAPKESAGHPEWDVILPSNPYSASKACQEAIAIAWWRSYGLPLIITNTMNNLGEFQAPSKFPAMVQQQVDRGEEVMIHAADNGEIGSRYYIHSRNTADAILFILRNVKPIVHSNGEIDKPIRLNIVGDKQLNNLELAQIIAKMMGKELKYKLVNFHKFNLGHDLHYGLDGSALARLGWKSPMPFEESLQNTIDWQKRNPEWLKPF